MYNKSKIKTKKITEYKKSVQLNYFFNVQSQGERNNTGTLEERVTFGEQRIDDC
jgi:hypothetical protein